MTEHPAHQYAMSVVNGKQVAGRYCLLACERYLRDLENAAAMGWEFRESTALAYLRFFERGLVHTVGKFEGKPFEPLPWQMFVLWNLYGWFNADGTRRFKYAYISVGRKNGKTTMVAGCALAAAIFDEEFAGQVYFAATKRDQARIGFDEALRMCQKSKLLRQVTKVGRHDIVVPKYDSRITYLSSDSRSLDGLNASFVAVDEFAFHRDDSVSNVLRSSMQARENPLHLTITTAGTFRGACYDLQKNIKQILDGVKEDEAQFGIIYELDENDDWSDESTWVKANPSMGATITMPALRNQYTQAKNVGGSYQTEFTIKHLNRWVNASKTWIPAQVWAANEEHCDLGGLPCFGGLDLASVSDLTAAVLVFPKGDEYHVRGWYWLPEHTWQTTVEREPSHPYARFIDQPNFMLTDGNVTDYAALRREITGVVMQSDGEHVIDGNMMQAYDVQKMAFDRYNSTQIAIDLSNDGVPITPFGQGFVSMSAPTKQLEVLVRSGKLKHDGDSVLAWALQNVELRYDPAGNIKPDKGKAQGKIDPIVALVMALGECIKAEQPTPDDMLKVWHI